MKVYQNPVFISGGDPCVLHYNDDYYFICSPDVDCCEIELRHAKTLTGVFSAPPQTIWTAPKSGNCCHNIWAPEIHNIKGIWYIYFSADDGVGVVSGDTNADSTRQAFVLRNTGADPMSGRWEEMGPLGTNPVGIDGTVIQNGDDLYFAYAAYINFPTRRSDLMIYQMSDPTTLIGEPVTICKAEYDWEIDSYEPQWKIVEGPTALFRNGKLYLVYSANTVWTDHYCLGMLSIDCKADFMNPDSWVKSQTPIFSQSVQNQAYAPGHNTFTTSPDGTEDWIVYHAIAMPYDHVHRFRRRDTCMKKIEWDKNGAPHLGQPTAWDTDYPAPSGE